MSSTFPTTWFPSVAPADAARFVVLLERVHQGEWRRIVRTTTGQLALKLGSASDDPVVFSTRDQSIADAIRSLNRRMSPLIFRRLRDDRTFGSVLLLEVARLLLENDVDLARGLLRRFVDVTCGFAQLAELTEGHPKSLIRMLGPHGNPSAKRLLAIFAQLASLHGVRFSVRIKSTA